MRRLSAKINEFQTQGWRDREMEGNLPLSCQPLISSRMFMLKSRKVFDILVHCLTVNDADAPLHPSSSWNAQLYSTETLFSLCLSIYTWPNFYSFGDAPILKWSLSEYLSSLCHRPFLQILQSLDSLFVLFQLTRDPYFQYGDWRLTMWRQLTKSTSTFRIHRRNQKRCSSTIGR